MSVSANCQQNCVSLEDGVSMEDFEKDVARFDAMIKSNPKDADAFLGRGNAYLGLGRYRKAMADFDIVLDLSPGNGEATENRAKAQKFYNIDEQMQNNIKLDW